MLFVVYTHGVSEYLSNPLASGDATEIRSLNIHFCRETQVTNRRVPIIPLKRVDRRLEKQVKPIILNLYFITLT